ncbi:MAG: hypothetical protein P0Y64_04660 [Candidatus Sphingomonas colombiensis]|nr:hypothetical protein [Sphingomonas sp.]WEK44124.1 MAG: hypothetical protein P0Y64_04660 [Sphingomonas sp.]
MRREHVLDLVRGRSLMIALDLAITTVRARGSASVAPLPLIAAISPEGWSAEFAKPAELPPITCELTSEMAPDSASKTFAGARVGFDAAGAATSYFDTRIVAKRTRQTLSQSLRRRPRGASRSTITSMRPTPSLAWSIIQRKCRQSQLRHGLCHRACSSAIRCAGR